MKSFRKYAKIAALILVAALVAAQFVRIEKTNPTVRADISADPDIKLILKRACYDCHSNETVWPWYSNVAPASWLLANDVSGGRQKLNFSEWGNFSGERQSQMLNEIGEEVESAGMPLWYYSIFHSESKLTREERNQIKKWTTITPASGEEPLP
ncbi:MAG: hypothetical protein H6Q07_2293 [Acidobacteria bacterium]|nr:hypothetical protein [Acidobacteriota bacterium]